ncbi:MAG: hypothetical protein WDW38_007040 [Sanguina aurantia]
MAKPPARVTTHLRASASVVLGHLTTTPTPQLPQLLPHKQASSRACLPACSTAAAAILGCDHAMPAAAAAVASFDDSKLHDGMCLGAGLVDCWLQLGQVFILSAPTAGQPEQQQQQHCHPPLRPRRPPHPCHPQITAQPSLDAGCLTVPSLANGGSSSRGRVLLQCSRTCAQRLQPP